MKILHIVNTYAPAGGIETYVLDLLPLLAARGHENVVIYRKRHPRTPDTSGRPIFHVPVTKAPHRDRAHALDIIHRERPDVLYLHDVYDPELMKTAAKIAPAVCFVHIFYPVCPGLGKLYRRTDQVCQRPFGLGCIPHIYLHDCASARHPRSVYRIMKRTAGFLEAFKQLPRVIVASQYMKELMIQNGIAPEHIEVLPLFIPIPKTGQLVGPQPDPHCPGILFAGRLEYEKGLP